MRKLCVFGSLVVVVVGIVAGALSMGCGLSIGGGLCKASSIGRLSNTSYEACADVCKSYGRNNWKGSYVTDDVCYCCDN